MLPGSKLIVESGARMNLTGNGKVYVYDADEWGPYVGALNPGKTFIPVAYAPGRTYNRTDADLVDAEIYVKSGAVLDGSQGYAYTTAGGANIHGDEGAVIKLRVGDETNTLQATYDGDNVNHNIPITPAQLKNADGTYVTGETNTYTYTNGVWVGHVHTEEIIPSKAPTCTEAGLTEGKKCSDCGEILVAQTTVAKLGHSYNSVVTDPTCTDAGYTTYTCDACGDSYVEEVAALGHNYNATVTAPTCTAAGYTTYTCGVCGDSYVADHTSALGHIEETLEAVAPTCTETGLTEGKKCTTCGTVTVEQQVVAANGHKGGAEANCIDAQTCTACGIELKAAYGHDYKGVVTTPMRRRACDCLRP